MKCRNCGEKRGLHPHFEFPGDLWCGDCYEAALCERAEEAIKDLVEFKRRTRRNLEPIIFNNTCFICGECHPSLIQCPRLKVY